ncbi:MAG: UbiA family prenyltransferase [Archaeoglobus sp.]|nr:UbiA family prenyltransferase [Archaeoglobus sp.]
MRKFKDYLDFIKIEHTLFALPFAYAGAFLASNGWFGIKFLILITLAFTGLRTAAMSLNRIIDREIDALNPRTADRHIPSGKISVKEGYWIAIVGFAVYFLSAYFINFTAFFLSPIPALTAWIYPYLKRYTCLSHYVLGLNLAFAPLGGWIAITNSIDPLEAELVPSLIGLALVFWVAGFDMIYALQDVDFDRKMGLHSIGAHFGERTARLMAALNHVVFFIILAFVFLFRIKGESLILGILLIGFLLFYEHAIVRKRYDEKRIQLAFFYSNAAISSIFFASILLKVLVN